MSKSRTAALVAIGTVLGILVSGTAVAYAAISNTTVKVCATRSGVVRSASSTGACPSHTSKRTINVTGPAGATGPQGPAGPAARSVYQVITPGPGFPAVPGAPLTVFCAAGSLHLAINVVYGPNVSFHGTMQRSPTDTTVIINSYKGNGTAGLVGDSVVTAAVVFTDETTHLSGSADISLRWDPSLSKCVLEGQVIPAA
jgi:hypothetical protein